MTRKLAAVLAVIPMGLGFLTGLIVGPFWYGVRAGNDLVEHFIESVPRRSRQ